MRFQLLSPVISLCVAAGLGARALAEQTSFYTRPDVHGDLVVFTCEGDLWLGSIKDKTAHRITSDPGIETDAHFSPDGATIAFTGQYDGGRDVYTMPIDGGAPRRLTYDPFGAEVLGWTGDGQSVLYRSHKTVTNGWEHKLFTVPAQGGISREVPVPRGEMGAMRSDGVLAYVPASSEWANWFRYRAGETDQLWIADLKGSFKKLTEAQFVDTTPTWSGNRLFFVSERSGVRNLFEMDPNSRRATQITSFVDAPVRYPSADSGRVVFEHGPAIALYDVATKLVRDLSFERDSDRIHTLPKRVPVAGAAVSAAVGPTGKRVALEVRGQIVTVPTETGEIRVVENTAGTRASLPAWSPDGTKIAFVSDRTGENEIWVLDAVGDKPATQLTHGMKGNCYSPVWAPDGTHIGIADRALRIMLVDTKTGDFKVVDTSPGVQSYDGYTPLFAFSPDGKYLAFQRNEDNWLVQVYLYEIGTGKQARVSAIDVNSTGPSFDSTGKFLIYLADRELNPFMSNPTQKYSFDNFTKVNMIALAKDTPSPFLPKIEDEGAVVAKPPTEDKKTKVDWDGLENRVIEVPMPGGRYQNTAAVAGKILALNFASVPDFNGAAPSELISFDLTSKATTTVMAGITGFTVSADGKKLLIVRPGGYSVVDATTGPTAPTTGAVNLAGFAITVHPEAEWKEVFEEGWRVARDFFYDPNMHGVDWNAVHRKYAARLTMVGDRADLTRLQADMLSELSTGHCYVGDPTPKRSGPGYGYLGADVESTPGEPGVRIKKIYRGDNYDLALRSPLLDPGVNVNVGDSILAVNGQAVKADEDIQALLIGTANQVVALTVGSKPTMTGARVVHVKPIGDERGLRYNQWVTERRQYVEKNGGPNFGYLHISDMSEAGLKGFVKAMLPNVYKEGMVYDVRYNGGGFISALVLENMAAKVQGWWQPRNGRPWTRENWATVGHKVALCNEYDFSDGELFSEMFKRMKIGPLIGHRTGGGEVGSGGGYALVDGGLIFVPAYGAFVGDQWIVEGHGVTPDIEVDEDPAQVMAGHDPQLDRAIAELKSEIVKNPVVQPKHPTYPIKAPKVGG